MTWPRESELNEFYGPKGENLVQIVPPYPMFLTWSPFAQVKKISINRRCADTFLVLLERVKKTYSEAGIESIGLNKFGGCSMVRLKRGSKTQWSTHSWACAFDFDDQRNQLKWGRDRARLAKSDAKEFWAICDDLGLVGLGPLKNYDWMHVQACRP